MATDRSTFNTTKNIPTGADVKKLFTAVSYAFSYEARAFIPGKPFQPSLMFAGKARAYPMWSTFQVLHSRVGSPPFLTNIRLGGKGLPRTKALAYYEKA